MVLPNQYGTEDIQNELLDIMKAFHNFCVEKDIEYFLYGGSCLGAVRHKGFIPWDDDLDICMDRANYNKLVCCFSECNGLKMHKTIWINRIQKVGATPIRGYVPTLDVFVIDNAPDKAARLRFKNFRLAILQGMLKEDVSYKGFSAKNKVLLFCTHLMGKCVPLQTRRKWYDIISQIGNNETTKSVHCTNTSYKCINNLYPSNTWDKAILADFEDTQFFIPKRFDSYLKGFYGDYMRLPDEQYRKPEHTEEA